MNALAARFGVSMPRLKPLTVPLNEKIASLLP